MTARQHRALAATLAAFALLAVGRIAGAQGIVASKAARPYVMLLLDTSGSMEWEIGSTNVPVCSPVVGMSGKSRWITAVEVLTGQIEDYTCTLDWARADFGGYQAGYYIPHVEPRSNDGPLMQRQDGLLDIHMDQISYGLMTFDSLPSPLTDELGMWSYPESGQTPPDRHVDTGSVQRVRWKSSSSAPNCEYDWNVGARRPSKSWPFMGGPAGDDIEGGMIPIYTEPPGMAHGWFKTLNKRVQAEILRVRPYWASPIAGLLHDTAYYFEGGMDEARRHLRAKTLGGYDCYADCRRRHVILITDGVPNTDGQPECDPSFAWPNERACPYPTSEEIAAEMYARELNLHVIGFAIDEEEPHGLKRPGKRVAWDIGLAGFGGVETNCPRREGKANPITGTEYFCALYADSLDELRDALTDVFDQVVEDAASQSKTATINTFVRPAKVMGQYQYFSSMNLATGGPWEGNLERVAHLCTQAGDGSWSIVPNPAVFDYGDDGLDQLSILSGDYSTRRLFTAEPSNPIAPAGDHPDPAELVRLDDSLDPADFGRATVAELRTLLDWVHGAEGTQREDRRLGAIFHTTPAIVGPPSLELPLASYRTGPHRSSGVDYDGDRLVGFQQLYAFRPQIVYSASTDGILHAFEVEAPAGVTTPRELWGFVPPMLLGFLHNQTLGESLLLDGHIAVQDMRLWKAQSGAGLEPWATVLVAGLRTGGGQRGYFALDVTAPIAGGAAPMPGASGTGAMRTPAPTGDLTNLAASSYGRPRLLWEITDQTETGSRFGALVSSAHRPDHFASLGLTYGRPAFGTVVLEANPPVDTPGEVGVVFLPAGRRPDGATHPSERHIGCGMYVVRASDGQLIRWLYPEYSGANPPVECSVGGGTPSCSYGPGADCQFVGTPLALGGVPGEVTTRVFVGDSQGRMYRADLRDPDPDQWTMSLFFDFGNDARQPILEPPAAARDERGLVTLVFGTGDPDDLEARPRNRMVSVTETFDFGASGALKPLTCAATWGQVHPGHSPAGDAENRIRPGYCTDVNQGVMPWVNWVIDFHPSSPADNALTVPFSEGERLVGSPVIFDEVAYFTTFVPNADPDECCFPGRGRVLGVHYVGAQATTTSTDVFRPPTEAEPSPTIELALLPENSIAFGLALVREPSCFAYDETVTFDWDGLPFTTLGASSPPSYRLVLHTNAPPSGGGPLTPTPETSYLDIQLDPPLVRCRPDTWSSIFGL